MAVEAHDDQIGILVGGTRQDHAADVGIGGGIALNNRLHAVPGKPSGDVGTRLFVAILLYLLNPRWMGWAEFALPPWGRWVGVLLGLVAVPAAWWVFTSIGRNVSETVLTKRDHALVTTGPYRWIRHPLYTTGAVLLLAIGLMAANWFVLLFALLAIGSLRLAVIPLEERELVNKFGDEYRRYMARTGRLLPRVWP